jgi:2-methylcitrate dehydratase PrpD
MQTAAKIERVGQPTLAATLVDFALGLTFDELPAEVVQAAKLHLADGIGVSLAGYVHDFARPALELCVDAGGNPQATIWATGQRTSASMAALTNGTLMHGLDYDDTHTEAIVHATAVIGPTVMAVGEKVGASGNEVITAAVAGYESFIRLGLAAPGQFHARGFHATAVCGVFASAIAAARLLGLDAGRATNAVAIAGSQAAGIHEFSVDYGSWMKRLHAGWAAHAGVIAAQLAGGGFTGPATVLEGSWGFFNTHLGKGNWDPDAVVAGLGERWETVNLAFKPYPSCHMTHAFIDAALELRDQVRLDDIESIQCFVGDGMRPFICDPWDLKQAPDGDYAAKFSLPFCVASALVNGRVNIDTFGDVGRTQREVLALAARSSYEVDPDSAYPVGFPGWVTIKTRDGRMHERKLDISRGTPGWPMTDEDVKRKFDDNVTHGGFGADAARLWSLLTGLEKQPSVRFSAAHD